MSGALYFPWNVPTMESSNVSLLLNGIPYSLSVMIILLSHEFGHYFAAKKFFVRATLPFCIPFPTLFGTAGAVIKVQSPIPDKKALFYIGIMGPFAGFVMTVIALAVGVYMSQVILMQPTSQGPLYLFGEPLIFKFFSYIFLGPIPEGWNIHLNPIAWAGWLGCLMTSLNLMPIGQLDGGHILYSIIGNKQRFFGWFSLVGITILSLFFYGWLLWIAITFFVLKVGHPPIPDKQNISLRERILGWCSMAIFIITFIPIPVEII